MHTPAGVTFSRGKQLEFKPALDKQEAVDRISMLSVGRTASLGPGSKERKALVVGLASALGIAHESHESKQQLAQKISSAKGISWLPDYESAGQTITLEGLNVLLEIADRELHDLQRDFMDSVATAKMPNWTIDELLLAAELVIDNGGQPLDDSDPRVLVLSGLLNASGVHQGFSGYVKFRSAGSVALKTANIAQHHPKFRGRATNGAKLDKVALDKFLDNPTATRFEASVVRAMMSTGNLSVEIAGADVEFEGSAAEGRILRIWQLKRERNPELRQKKINSVTRAGRAVECEVCHFNFGVVYGQRGAGYIEVHHKQPLHVSGETVTVLEDLALLCANCHRIIHRSGWITVEALQMLVRQAN